MSTVDNQGYASFDELAADDQLDQEDYVIEDTGQRVRIRPLTRAEVLLAQKLQEQGPGAMEAQMLSYALVEPRLSVGQAKRLQAATPAGRLEGLTRRINDISGMNRYAEREAYERFRGRPADGVRGVSGSEAGQDGAGTQPDDQ